MQNRLYRNIFATIPLFVLMTGVVSGQASDDSEEVITLSPFEVSSEGDKGYGASYSYGATRINVPKLEVPTSIITVSSQLLSDVSAQENVYNGLKFVSGVNVASSPGNGQLTIRGYNVSLSSGATRDGLSDPMSAGFGFTNFESATYERVEVIKGAAATLYGTHTLGGLFNKISKVPQAERATTITAGVGSDERWSIELDTTGSVGKSKKLLYRFIFAERNQNEVWGGEGVDHTRVIAPRFTYNVSPDFKLWFSFEYANVKREVQTSHLWTDSEFNIGEFIPRETPIDEINKLPDDHERFFYELGMSTNFEMFNVPWSMRIVARANTAEFDDVITDKLGFNYVDANGDPIINNAGEEATDRNTTWAELFANPLWASGPQQGDGNKSNIVGGVNIRRSIRDQAGSSKGASINLELVGDFSIGPTDHKLLAYTAFGAGESKTIRARFDFTPIDIINPQYVNNPVTESRLGFNSFLINTDNSGYGWNFGMQDNMKLFDGRLILVGGTRYSRSRSETNDFRRDSFRTSTVSGWVSKYGLVIRPWLDKGFSIYLDHSETITPRSGVDERGNHATDHIGTSEEIGIKLDLWDSRLVMTASVFDMVLDGFQANDFIFVGEEQFRVFVDAGANLTDGWEMDLAFAPNDNFSMVFGVGDITSVSRRGLRFRHVSEGVNYQLWAKYEFTEGALAGFEAAFGYIFVNGRAADGADNFSLPEFDQLELMVGYRHKNWRLQLNVTNLEDEYFPISSINRTRLYISDPRLWKLNVSYRF